MFGNYLRQNLIQLYLKTYQVTQFCKQFLWSKTSNPSSKACICNILIKMPPLPLASVQLQSITLGNYLRQNPKKIYTKIHQIAPILKKFLERACPQPP